MKFEYSNDTKVCEEFYKAVDINNARYYKVGDRVCMTGIVCGEPDLASGRIPIKLDDVNGDSPDFSASSQIHTLSNYLTKIKGGKRNDK